METQRLTKKDSAQIVEILNRGGVVAFPTDTVYGLAVRYDLKEAILKMKEAKQRPEIDELVTNGFPTIGIRMPDDDFVLEIINRVGVPLLVPSANLSGQPSCTTSEEVLKQLDGRIDAVVLGESGASTASTVCDTTGDELKILRQGPIKLEDLEASI